VRIYDLTAHGVALAGKGPKLLPGAATVAPVFEFGGHADEGFAMDWSKVTKKGMNGVKSEIQGGSKFMWTRATNSTNYEEVSNQVLR